MIYIYFALFFFCTNQIQSCFYTAEISSHPTLIFSIPVNMMQKKSAWDYFFSAAFDFPLLLEQAERNKLSVILICPTEINGLSPVDDHAPVIEGARVAIAWASTYFRFKNVDVRVALTDHSCTTKEINYVVTEILSQPIINGNTPEQSFKNRIFYCQSYDQSLSRLSINIQPIKLSETTENSFKIPAKHTDRQRILITGGAGFIGSHVARTLVNEGYHVIALDSLLCASKKNITDLLENENFEFHQVDVTKPYDIEGSINSILHLASVPSPEFYYHLPIETLMTGLHGVKCSLDLAKKKGARFLFSSTSEVYGDPLVSPQPEEYAGNVNPWGKRSQYDQSKRGGETICKYYFETFGLDIRIARIFNTYGPGMSLNDGRAVTNFIRSVLRNEPITIYGNGNQTRSFCFVSDLVSGLMFLLNSEEIAQKSNIQEKIFNVGNGTEFTIADLAQKINQVAIKKGLHAAPLTYIENPDVTDPKQRRPNLARIATMGYNPHIELEKGLGITLEHFMNQT